MFQTGREQRIEFRVFRRPVLPPLTLPDRIVRQHHATTLHQVEADLLIIAGHAVGVEVAALHHDSRNASG